MMRVPSPWFLVLGFWFPVPGRAATAFSGFAARIPQKTGSSFPWFLNPGIV
jgi:hypothetical protein